LLSSRKLRIFNYKSDNAKDLEWHLTATYNLSLCPSTLIAWLLSWLYILRIHSKSLVMSWPSILLADYNPNVLKINIVDIDSFWMWAKLIWVSKMRARMSNDLFSRSPRLNRVFAVKCQSRWREQREINQYGFGERNRLDLVAEFFFNRPAGLGISNNPDINVIDCHASGMMIENHLPTRRARHESQMRGLVE